MLFLHEMGYSYFNMNALTIAECNTLVKAFNEREKEKEKQMKSAKNRH